MNKVAGLLGKSRDQQYYTDMLEELKRDFNRHFLDPDSWSYGSSQTANVLALDMDIVPEGLERKICMAIITNIRESQDGFLNTGIFGLPRVFKVLSENGYEDEVYRLLHKTGENSFAHMWEEFQVTTLWESLPTRTAFGAEYRSSMNHPMQAGFDAWFYSGIAGINPSEEGPGFQVINFKPYLTRHLEHASANYESASGTIQSAWERRDEQLRWKIRIPPLSRGRIQVPVYNVPVKVRINGKTVDIEPGEDGFAWAGEFPSGEYLVEVSPRNI
jgi:alpha-L-rhamnosidase